jgi:hypothetical protein
MTRMIRRIGAIVMLGRSPLLIFVGINSNDPYLISLRGAPNVLVLLLGASVAASLALARLSTRSRVPRTLLISDMGARAAVDAVGPCDIRMAQECCVAD